MAHRFVVSSAAALALVAACGSGDDAAIGDPGTWFDTYATRLCAKAQACRDSYPTPAEFVSRWGDGEAACRLVFLTADEVRASVSAGHAVYDEDAGRDCLSALPYDGESCATFWAAGDPDVCKTVLVGQVPLGGACTSNLDCVPGLTCSGAACRSSS